MSTRWPACEPSIIPYAQSISSPARSQCRIGTGKPSFARFSTWAGTIGSSARRSAYLVVVRVIFWSNGSREATANTSGSRNGTRNSSELAIVILSAFTRMSPRSQVNRSMCCMRATGSQPADSA